MDPISQQEVIKQIFCFLIVEKYSLPWNLPWKRMQKTKDLDLSYNWPLFRAVDMQKKHLLLQYVQYVGLYQNQKCCTTFASLTIMLKSVQSVKCKLFTMFNFTCGHFNQYCPHLLQSSSLQQHSKMFSKIMLIIRTLYLSTDSGWVDLATSNIFLSVLTVAIVESRIFMLINRILASWQIRFALTTSILKGNIFLN